MFEYCTTKIPFNIIEKKSTSLVWTYLDKDNYCQLQFLNIYSEVEYNIQSLNTVLCAELYKPFCPQKWDGIST